MKPAFWSDAKVAELSERTRLFYIGLWMIADDAGWLRWDAIEVARDLYGYETRTKRERRVGAMWSELVEAKRVVVHDCGHAEIPTMPGHQRLAGATRQVTTIHTEHQRQCMTPRASPHIPADPRHGKERLGTVEGNGQVRSGTVAREGEEKNERLAAFRRQGLPVDAA